MSEHKRSKSGGNQSISRHPLFPAIVALWCGALFGAGSIMLPPALIESVVTALGIDRVLPMAAPPLGATARTLIALLMTALGSAIGVWAARRLAVTEPQGHQRRRSSAAAASDEPANEEAPAPARRRRSLAVEPHTAAEDDSLAIRKPDAAPGRHILNVAEFELSTFDEAGGEVPDEISGGAAPGADEELVPSSFAAPEPFSLAEPCADETPTAPPAGSLFETYTRGVTAHEAAAAATPFTPPAASPAPGFDLHPDEEACTQGAGSVAADCGEAPLSGEEDSAAAPSGSATIDTEQAVPGSFANNGHKAAERIAAAQLDELSPIELLERLALAMAQRREHARHAAVAQAQPDAPAEVEAGLETRAEPEATTFAAQPPFATLPPEPLPFSSPRLEAVPPEAAPAPAAEATASEDPEPADMVPHVPFALRPVRFGDLADTGDDALPAYIPPRHIGRAAAAEYDDQLNAAALSAQPADEITGIGEDEEPDEEEDLVLEEGYSSLLGLSRPQTIRENPIQRFIGSEDAEAGNESESVAIFPGEEFRANGPFAAPSPEGSAGEAPPAASKSSDRLFDGPGTRTPEDTEQALRDALSALQRMSGAA